MSNNFYNNLDDRQFKASYWLVSNRVYLRTILILLLGLIAGGLFLLGAGGLFKYYVLDRNKNLVLEQSISANQLNQKLLAEVGRPESLQIIETRVFQPNSGNTDFVAVVLNPNTQWVVEEFDYSFQFGEETTNIKTDFILPEQKKYVLSLNVPTTKTISAAELKLENVKWKKVADYGNLFEKFNQFEFQNVSLLSSKKSGVSEKGAVANIRFDILNKTPYSFLEPKFVVLLSQRNSLIGVSQMVLPELRTGEKRTESFNLFQELSDSTQVEIVPDINILNPEVFRGFDNSSGELK